MDEMDPYETRTQNNNTIGGNDKWPLLLTWFNFNPSMDK